MSGVTERKVCTAETPNDFAVGAIWSHPNMVLTSQKLTGGTTLIGGACPHCGLALLPELEMDDDEYDPENGDDGRAHDWMQP